MKVLVLGAKGWIGTRLSAALRARTNAVVSGSLRDPIAAAKLAEGCDVVVNLAGESVAQRWTPNVKAAIRSSRTELPHTFLEALRDVERKPTRYVSASAIGYYGTSETETFDEESGPGNDFLASVCVGWEEEAQLASDLGLHVSIVRTGLVLGGDGGALAKLLPLFRSGGGGVVASGKQWYSWIHIDDVVGIYLHAIDGADGVFNATAPEPVRNAEFTKTLAHVLSRPAIIPVPAFALKLMLGEGATVAVDGQRVLPKRTLESGYAFRYPALQGALTDIV